MCFLYGFLGNKSLDMTVRDKRKYNELYPGKNFKCSKTGLW